MKDEPRPLEGRVAVVTGATRRAGRGIAIELGIAGATVICTGRSVRGTPSGRGGSETIEETAEMVEAFGGRGIPVRVDHTDVGQVEQLFDRVWAEHGRLDLLVNAVSGESLNEPFLETDLGAGLQAIVDGGHSQIIATHVAARRMTRAGTGLIVNVSDHEWDQFYALQKALINQIGTCVAEELKRAGVIIVTLLPGAFFKCFGVTTLEELRKAAEKDPTVSKCHTPRLIGRGVVALATDSRAMTKAGRRVELKELVTEYGHSDLDGRTSGEMW